MKKVKAKAGELQLSGEIKEVICDEWRFTDEEKVGLRVTLKDYAPEDKIKTFIDQLEFYCAEKKAIQGIPPKVARKERERILANCKAALNGLKEIGLGRADLVHDGNIDYFDREDPNGEFLDKMFFMAREIIGPLDEFVRVLEAYQLSEVKRGGNPPVGSDHFIRRVKDLYIEHIDATPTAYESGRSISSLFPDIVKKIYAALDLPNEDRSKQIKAALKET